MHRMKTVAGVEVCITTPKNPKALTFILTGANLSLDNYESIKNCLVELDHVVVGFYISVLMPPYKNNRKKARQVKDIYNELNRQYKFNKYNIVGHSIGGKIALMVAALHNSDDTLNRILALDPVDQSPVEFTNSSASNNLSLNDVRDVKITMTCTRNAYFLSNDHDAVAILEKQHSAEHIKVLRHTNASHIAYCDEVKTNGMISWKQALDGGNSVKNRAVKEETLEFLKEKFTTCVAQKAVNEIATVNLKVADKVHGMFSEFKKDIKKAF